MAKWEEMVQVEIYIAGKGPKHKIEVPLQGWERKQVDLEGIMSKYRLNSIYAYSLTSGRGLELLYNPRNGLSFVSYSGKPDAVIRIDGDPKPTVTFLVGRYLLAAVLIGLVIVGTTTSQAHWFVQIQDLASSRVAWLGYLVTMIATQLAWRPFKRRS